MVGQCVRVRSSGMLGYGELLEWKPDAPPGDRVERAQAIIRSATHMANLMDKTLKTARLETGHFSFDFGLVDLATKVLEVGRRLPEEPGHPLRVQAPEFPLPCWADGERVTEVLENLVTNAVKYSPAGGPIALQIRAEGETAVISVSDRGIGIAPTDIPRLFPPLSRVRDRYTQGIEGFGLGLYICERIVRAHGGRLSVESTPGHGSTFSFSLPLFWASAQAR